ncbi:MAG: hypothetical protein RL748_1860, partial [Pseudomonadota bacterium]
RRKLALKLLNTTFLPLTLALSLSSLIALANQEKVVSTEAPASDSANGKKALQAPLAAEKAQAASPRARLDKLGELNTRISNHFDLTSGQRSYIQVDKPLYKPGETIWFKVWDLQLRALGPGHNDESTVELISPKGASVIKKRLRMNAGSASAEFDLPPEVQGGEYSLRSTAPDGTTVERAVIVSSYEAPRMKKKLEFIKKAYGAGDAVSATVEVKRPTGEVLAGKSLTAVATVDGIELPRVKVSTNAEGAAVVKFDLPKNIESGEGLLTILVEDGGVTESISKSIPLIQKKLALGLFPEGGKMVAGLPTRLYFEAKNPIGKPADIEGRLVDDLGNAVAQFASYKNGLGRVQFTPASGRSYHAEITRPASIKEKFALPLVEQHGCVLRSFDDFDGQESALRVAVRCSETQKVVVAATLRENLLDSSAIEAGPEQAGVAYLTPKNPALAKAAGVARITVFDANLTPLAERLVFRNRRNRLQVQVEPQRKSYAPREQVTLNITTRDAAGKPVAADLALSVVDDTVLSFADDKSAHLLSKLLLEPELPGKIEEPNFYLDLSEAKSGPALDLLMGARGYRRFDWVSVLSDENDYQVRVKERDLLRLAKVASAPRPVAAAALPPAAPMEMRPPPPPAPPAQPVLQAPKGAAAARVALPEAVPLVARAVPNAPPVVMHEVAAKPRAEGRLAQGLVADRKMDAQAENRAGIMAEDKDFAQAAKKAKRAPGLLERQREPVAWAVARVFPVPSYMPGYRGERDDFRETVFWAPAVKTDKAGRASVKLVLSDAVTSFRVLSEGAGAGLLGRDETVFKSSLPFSLSAKLPLELSSGDKPLIPVTLSNDSERSQEVKLSADFGKMLKATGSSINGGTLAAGERKSWFVPVEVSGSRGESQVRLAANGSGLKDEVLRSIPVVPSGFPQLLEKSGQVKTEVNHDIDISHATAGSVQASVRVYTSSLSTMISGLDGMLQEPNGCFEQTSSTNYPNVMIMQYMKQHDVADPALLERSGKLLDSGYKKLAGFESKNKGYEWFGGDPGHEALTAYGLLEFADMKDIYGAVDQAMLTRTANWLKARRDGKGGYLRDAKALDSFGRAAPEVTDAYITWALVSSGESGLDKEIAQSAKLAQSTQDAYQLALATGTLLTRSKGAAPSAAALAAADKLAKMQSNSGEWRNADHSITRSGGVNLQIETTSLAILALLKTNTHLENARRGITWLQNNRSGFGQWGATQATVLALKAMIAYDNVTRVASAPGAVSLLVDGVLVAEQSYAAGQREALIFTNFDSRLSPGKHRITLRSKSGVALPYSLAVEYRSNAPVSSKAAVVKLDATLDKAQLKMGETVRMQAVISNTTQSGQPMTLVRLGIPAGLGYQTWQLKELREKGQIAFFETRAREVIFYLRDMKPGEIKKLGIDLVANVPGSYTGPASSAYLYYNDSDKSWAAPLPVKIHP